MVPTSNTLGYAFDLALPPEEDQRLRAWTQSTPGATWDVSGGHVTLARLTGSVPPEQLAPVVHQAWSGIRPFDVALTQPAREPYWDKPGLEIVMLIGESPHDVSGVLDLRRRLLDALLPAGLELREAGDYVPHLTLTTGLPPREALRLEAAAQDLRLRFTVQELTFWCGGESRDPQAPADPPWSVVERWLLR